MSNGHIFILTFGWIEINGTKRSLLAGSNMLVVHIEFIFYERKIYDSATLLIKFKVIFERVKPPKSYLRDNYFGYNPILLLDSIFIEKENCEEGNIRRLNCLKHFSWMFLAQMTQKIWILTLCLTMVSKHAYIFSIFHFVKILVIAFINTTK